MISKKLFDIWAKWAGRYIFAVLGGLYVIAYGLPGLVPIGYVIGIGCIAELILGARE